MFGQLHRAALPMLPTPHCAARSIDPWLWLAALLACGLPTLLAYHPPPSATLFKQCLAVIGWGAWVVAVRPGRVPRVAWPVLGALGLLSGAAALSSGLGSLPASLAGSAIGLLACAALLLVAGAGVASHPQRLHAVAQAFFGALLVAGLLSALVALVQVWAPQWADGEWIAASTLAGRAVGNVRQPNHLCSLLLWAMVAAVALHEWRWFGAKLLWALMALLVLAIELSASRTGAVGLLVLVLWGLLDRRLSRTARLALVCAPLLYGVAYGAMALYSSLGHQALGAGARLQSAGLDPAGLAEGGSRNARANIWRNAWDLVAGQPWLGVGFGEFNLAWTLTPFAGRPTAFFDHTHNLLLHWAVELGLPLAALVTGLLAWSVWQGLRRCWRVDGPAGGTGRAAMVLVLLMALHSMVEYPLWYAYFLLPTAFAWGLALGVPLVSDGVDRLPAPEAPSATRTPRLLGLLMVAAGAFAIADYLRVAAIFSPSDTAPRLAERIEQGQRSVFFAHHADYAAATNTSTLRARELAFARAPHALLDARMMVAWAYHLQGQGRSDEARWVAARLREFDNPGAAEFFAPCKDPATPAFQCQAPAQPHSWRSFTNPARD